MEQILKVLLDVRLVDAIMQNLASYIVYIYPGIITIYIFNFLYAKKTKDTQALIIKSFAISYLYNLFLMRIFDSSCFERYNIQKKYVRYNIILIIVSIIVPYIINKFANSDLFAQLCSLLKINTSITDSPFELLGDKDEQYTCLKVYLKNEPCVYIGFMQEYEYENEENKFLILSGYRKYFIDNKMNEKLVEGHKAKSYKEKVLIMFSDIKRIEKVGLERANKKIYNC